MPGVSAEVYLVLTASASKRHAGAIPRPSRVVTQRCSSDSAAVSSLEIRSDLLKHRLHPEDGAPFSQTMSNSKLFALMLAQFILLTSVTLAGLLQPLHCLRLANNPSNPIPNVIATCLGFSL